MLKQLNGTVIIHYSERENELSSWTKWDGLSLRIRHMVQISRIDLG